MTPKLRTLITGVVVVVLGVFIVLAYLKERREPPIIPDPPRAVVVTDTVPPDTITSLTASLPRFLELGSATCKPCKAMEPVIKEIRQEYSGKLSVEFYDVWQDPLPGQQYRIRVIPTQIFLTSAGKEFARHEGYLPKEEIVAILDRMNIPK